MIIIATSCSRPVKDYGSLDFPQNVDIDWELHLSETAIPQPREMLVKDSCLYILGQSGHKWLHIFNQEDLSYLCSVIADGNLESNIKNGHSLNFDSSNQTFNIFDSNYNTLKSYSEDYAYQATACYDSLFKTVNGIYLISPTVTLVDAPVFYDNKAAGHSGIYSINSLNGSIISEHYDYPKDSIIDLNKHLIFKTFSFSNDKFAVMYPESWRFSLFNLTDNGNINLICDNDYTYTMAETDAPTGFRSIDCTDEFIYISFLESASDKRAYKIGVWDWNGRPIKAITTDKDIVNFTVSPDDSDIYGIVNDTEYSYQLAHIKL